MKYINTLLILISIVCRLNGQEGPSISLQVISSMGGFNYIADSDVSLSWTLGETFIATYSNTTEDLFLTQGFQQPHFSGSSVLADKFPHAEFQIKVYPNPATDYLRIDWITDKKQEVHVELYDLVGRKISHKKSDNSVTHIQMDLQSYQRSSYLLKVFTKDGTYSRTFRIIKL